MCLKLHTYIIIFILTTRHFSLLYFSPLKVCLQILFSPFDIFFPDWCVALNIFIVTNERVSL